MSEFLSILKEEESPVASPTAETGRRGEELAAEFLEVNGYRLVLANFTTPIGRNRRGATVTGEIDIVALDGDMLCFIEVKAKTSDDFSAPLATVTRRKQRQITRTARVYQRIFGLQEMARRFDVVSIVLPPNSEPRLELVQSFWSESKFRKKRWRSDIY